MQIEELEIDKLVELKRNQHKTNYEIAKILSIDKMIVGKKLKEYNITYKEKDKYFLKEMLDSGLSQIEMAEICKCGKHAIKGNLIKFGLMEDNRKIRYCHYCNKPIKSINTYNGNIYCSAHYNQLRRYGKLIKETINNEIIIKEDYAEICLCNKFGEIINKTIIDISDINKIKGYYWKLRKDGYCATKIDGSTIMMHNIISKNPDRTKYFNDHINRNKLDNRKNNLRLATFSENSRNGSKRTTNTSGVVGLHFDKRDRIWTAHMTHNYKTLHLCRSTSFDECVKARLEAECKYFGKYSPNYNKSTNTIRLTYLSHDDNEDTFIEYSLGGMLLNFTKL